MVIFLLLYNICPLFSNFIVIVHTSFILMLDTSLDESISTEKYVVLVEI